MARYSIMNFFYLILLCQFIYVKTIGPKKFFRSDDSGKFDLSSAQSSSTLPKYPSTSKNSDESNTDTATSDCESNSESGGYGSLPPSDVKINLVTSPNSNEYLNLRQTDGMLANQHLPVWAIQRKLNQQSEQAEDEFELQLKLNVMNQLGKFTMYQDSETCSAAVYFHRRRQFDGIVDNRYYIRGLSIDKLHSESKTKVQLGKSGIIPRPRSIAHHLGMADIDTDYFEMTAQNIEVRPTYGNRLYNGYPEILVVVAEDVARRFLKNPKISERYTSIVSHVLTLFNGVDMLYSKLKEPKIKINIAGIIIATEFESLTLLKNCYNHQTPENPEIWLEANCVIRGVATYLFMSRTSIPYDSYDLVVFLTERKMKVVENGQTLDLYGRSAFAPIYQTRFMRQTPMLVAVIYSDKDYGSYGTIAHEIAHIMSIKHDNSPFVQEEKCVAHLMKPYGNWCKNCLTWSEASKNALKAFFRTADCCTFINKPRSLHPPGRMVMLTGDDQCQCYGYKYTITFRDCINMYCEHSLHCQSENSDVVNTIIPMDGTPCAPHKVCSGYKCEKIGFFQQYK